MTDPYAVLGVSYGASEEEIRRAYRIRSKECHPDLHPGDPGADARFKELGEAYHALMDPVSRMRYAPEMPPTAQTLVSVLDGIGVLFASYQAAQRAGGRKVKDGVCVACRGEKALKIDVGLVVLTRECPLCQGTGVFSKKASQATWTPS